MCVNGKVPPMKRFTCVTNRDMTKFDLTPVMKVRAAGRDCVANPGQPAFLTPSSRRKDIRVITADYLAAIEVMSLLRHGGDRSKYRSRMTLSELSSAVSSPRSFSQTALDLIISYLDRCCLFDFDQVPIRRCD